MNAEQREADRARRRARYAARTEEQKERDREKWRKRSRTRTYSSKPSTPEQRERWARQQRERRASMTDAERSRTRQTPEYRAANAERIAARKHEHYVAHADQIKADKRAYYEANRERVLARMTRRRMEAKGLSPADEKAEAYAELVRLAGVKHQARTTEERAQWELAVRAQDRRYRRADKAMRLGGGQ